MLSLSPRLADASNSRRDSSLISAALSVSYCSTDGSARSSVAIRRSSAGQSPDTQRPIRSAPENTPSELARRYLGRRDASSRSLRGQSRDRLPLPTCSPSPGTSISAANPTRPMFAGADGTGAHVILGYWHASDLFARPASSYPPRANHPHGLIRLEMRRRLVQVFQRRSTNGGPRYRDLYEQPRSLGQPVKRKTFARHDPRRALISVGRDCQICHSCKLPTRVHGFERRPRIHTAFGLCQRLSSSARSPLNNPPHILAWGKLICQ